MKEIKKVFARRLRKEQTKAEKKVWELLRINLQFSNQSLSPWERAFFHLIINYPVTG